MAEWSIWIGLLQLVVTTIVGALGYLLKSTLDQIRAAQKDHADRLNRHEDELATVRRDLQDYATKEEFVRESSCQRQKLDQILQRLSHDEGMKAALMEFAATVAAAVNRRDQ